jgi:soluble lytic murein transglycosylase-like protein
MKKIIMFLLLLLVMTVVDAHRQLIVPVKIQNNENTTLVKLQTLGIESEKIASSIDMASRQSGLSREFLIALMFTESRGIEKATSSMGYKGLMQIPWPVYYTDANVLIGAHIFNEKMKITNNDMKKALCLYKGYPINSERGIQQANKVIKIYAKLLEET